MELLSIKICNRTRTHFMCGIIIYVYIALKGSWDACNKLNLSIDLVHEARRHRHLNAQPPPLCVYQEDAAEYNMNADMMMMTTITIGANIMHTERPDVSTLYGCSCCGKKCILVWCAVSLRHQRNGKKTLNTREDKSFMKGGNTTSCALVGRRRR